MADDQVRITIICDRELKRRIKQALLNHNIDQFQDGYKMLLELGLKEYEKGGNKKA